MTPLDDTNPVSGLFGTLRLIAMMTVLAIAGLGVSAVLEVMPLAAVTELAIKLAALAAIVVVATVLIGLLMRGNRR